MRFNGDFGSEVPKILLVEFCSAVSGESLHKICFYDFRSVLWNRFLILLFLVNKLKDGGRGEILGKNFDGDFYWEYLRNNFFL